MKRWRFVIIVALFALVASACANSEGDSTTTTATGGTDGATTTTAGTDGGDGTTTTEPDGSMDGPYEHLAKAEAAKHTQLTKETREELLGGMGGTSSPPPVE